MLGYWEGRIGGDACELSLNQKGLVMRYTVLWMFIFAFLYGCSAQPKPSGYWFETQKKMQSARHWEILANDISSCFTEVLAANNNVSSPIFIESEDISSFGKSLRSFLATDLVKGGMNVTPKREAPLRITWNVQIVRSGADRNGSMYPGTITALSAIGYGVHKALEGGTAMQVIGSGVAADAAYQVININDIPVPHNEIVVNANLINKDKGILERQTYVYYVNDADTGQYSESPDSVLNTSLPENTKIYKVRR